MLTLKRRKLLNYTTGFITLPDGQVIYTLERPWIDNEPYISCIPNGVYVINRDTTGKHQWFSIPNVVGRSAIEIHPANRVDQLQGCIAPCMELKGDRAVRSTEACELLLKWFGDSSWAMEIQ